MVGRRNIAAAGFEFFHVLVYFFSNLLWCAESQGAGDVDITAQGQLVAISGFDIVDIHRIGFNGIEDVHL